MALDLYLLTTRTECNELLGPVRGPAVSPTQPQDAPAPVLTAAPTELTSLRDSLPA
jgi:hypothetical protein